MKFERIAVGLVVYLSISLHAKAEVGNIIEGAQQFIYKETAQAKLVLNAFFPSDAEHNTKRKSPAVVFFFGGGWKGGDPNQFASHCRYLASRGMVAMSADYRVKSRQQTTPFECVKDGKSAVRWIRSKAEELGIDPDRIAAGGGSAGGHVAAATGTIKGMNEEGENLLISSRPNAMILFNPVYDNGPEGYGYNRVQKRWREISPMHNIRKGIPPTIVFLGSEDNLIPESTAEKFKRRMEKVGSLSKLYIYKGQTHGFFNYGKEGNFYEKTILEVDKFLISLGWLEGEPSMRIP